MWLCWIPFNNDSGHAGVVYYSSPLYWAKHSGQQQFWTRSVPPSQGPFSHFAKNSSPVWWKFWKLRIWLKLSKSGPRHGHNVFYLLIGGYCTVLYGNWRIVFGGLHRKRSAQINSIYRKSLINERDYRCATTCLYFYWTMSIDSLCSIPSCGRSAHISNVGSALGEQLLFKLYGFCQGSNLARQLVRFEVRYLTMNW